MIPEDLQDQAALYVMGALTPTECAAFEAAMNANTDLLALVREMREAAADIGASVPQQQPPLELKQRVLREIALEKQAGASRNRTAISFNGLPWAIAALFIVFCGILAVDRSRLHRELAAARSADPLSQVTIVSLAAPAGEHPDAKATVAWQSEKQSGLITINNLPPANEGRDYQLWAVDDTHKDPINAGIIQVDPSGITRVRFKPDQHATQIKAFAISLERKGGVPKREGPILMIGSA